MKLNRSQLLKIIKEVTAQLQEDHPEIKVRVNTKKMEWICDISFPLEKFLNMLELFWENLPIKNYHSRIIKLLKKHDLSTRSGEDDEVVILNDRKHKEGPGKLSIKKVRTFDVAKNIEDVNEVSHMADVYVSSDSSTSLQVISMEANAMFLSKQTNDSVKSWKESSRTNSKRSRELFDSDEIQQKKPDFTKKKSANKKRKSVEKHGNSKKVTLKKKSQRKQLPNQKTKKLSKRIASK